jgi:hypothetical protein
MMIVIALVGVLVGDGCAQDHAAAGHQPLMSWYHSAFRPLSWEEVHQAAESPRAICWQVRRHLVYREEMGEQWFSGRTVWERGYGDCDDFASCVADLCEDKGYPCWITAVFPVGSRDHGHCVTMGLWRGKLWISSNGAYDEVASLDDALKRLAVILGRRGQKLEFVPLSLM